MDLSSVKAYLSDGGKLAGLKATLNTEDGYEKLPLTHIGGKGSRTKNFGLRNSPDMISILYDDWYVCNVILHTKDGPSTSLAKNPDCQSGKPGISETSLKIKASHPLVGFHAHQGYNDQLMQLGVIWLDANNPECKKRLSLKEQKEMYEGGVPTAMESWLRLSDAQKRQGKELEGLLTFHSIIQSQND